MINELSLGASDLIWSRVEDRIGDVEMQAEGANYGSSSKPPDNDEEPEHNYQEYNVP